MKTIIGSILLMFVTVTLNGQAIIVKNLQGQDIDLYKVINVDEPLLHITWSNAWCYPCEKIMDKLTTEFSELQTNHKLRIVALNVDTDSLENFSSHYNYEHSKSMGPYKSITDFVKKYTQLKKWKFDMYVDEAGNFTRTTGLDAAPYMYFYHKKKNYFLYGGFNVPEHLEDEHYSHPEIIAATTGRLKNIISGYLNGNAYFDKDWKLIAADENPEYKRTLVKIGDLYEITDSWISGELQMKGSSYDKTADTFHGEIIWYYKTGIPANIINYSKGVRQGKAIEYYSNGQIKFEGAYKNDKYHGKWIGYHSNGQLKVEHSWEEGKLLTISYLYDKNGQALDKGTLIDGNGTRRIYNDDNKLIAIEHYKEGELEL